MIVNKYNYISIPREEVDGVRKYVTPDGNKVPSVTTILAAVKDMTYLDQWVKNVGVENAERIKKEAATLGTGMHQNLENYILGRPIVGSFMEKALANLIIKKGLSKVDEIWGTEVAVYSSGLYAGTTDLVGLHMGIPSIMDFKNSRTEKELDKIEDYLAQLGAYAIAHNEMYGTEIHRGVLMIATRDARYQEFIFEGKEFDRCIELWLTALESYYKKLPGDK